MVALALTMVCGLCAVAAAQSPSARSSLTLHWSAPAGCPEARAVEREVARLLGDTPSASGARVEARAQVVERGPSDWVLTLRTVQAGDRGERVLEGRSCLEVSHAGAFILAFTIDPDAASRQAAAGDARESQDHRPPGKTSVASAHGPPTDRLAVSVEARVLTGVGLLPGTAWGVGAASGLHWRRLGLSAFGHYWFKETAWLAGQEKGGDFDLYGGGAVFSMTVLRRQVSLDAFVGAEVDHLRARGRGVDVVEKAKANFVAALAGAAFQVPMSQHGYASAVIHAAVPSSRRRFELEGLGPVYRSSPVNGRLALCLGWLF
jgi:hypothetical protein